jgi:hypothetical protein
LCLDAPSSSALSPEQEMENRQSILNYGDQLADYLKKGLADNWSQVTGSLCFSGALFVQACVNPHLFV